ncbi:hypothetical protein ACNKHK_21535 [Shigella flexneri]
MLDESFVVIDFRNLEGIYFPWLLVMLQGHSFLISIRRPYRWQNGSGNGIDYAAAGAATNGRQKDRVTLPYAGQNTIRLHNGIVNTRQPLYTSG